MKYLKCSNPRAKEHFDLLSGPGILMLLINTLLCLSLIASAPPTRFAYSREKQVSRLTKCPIEILNLRVIPTKKRVAFSSPCYIIH